MANFEKLEEAMRAWVREAIARLSSGSEPDVSPGLRRWQRDSDGIFRVRERPTRVWRHTEVQALQELPSWHAVEEALQEDDRLRAHLNQLVGTVQGGVRFDAETAGHLVLPLPDEVGDLEGAFARRYGELDRFLAAEEIESVVVWPLPGLTSSEFPIALEQDLELDLMSDDELAAVLNTDVLRLARPGLPLLFPEQSQQACLRYRYRLPKLVGQFDQTQTSAQLEALEEWLNATQETLDQVLALSFADPVAISGRASLHTEWTLLSGSVTFQQAPITLTQRFRKLHIDEQASGELVETWRQLRQPGLLQKQKALALGLRRLSYQAHRQRVEDEMVDIMVAAEALYLSDLGPEELGFRLALRASALCDPEKLGMTRRNVFDLMKSAYAVRSKIVHGDVPRPRDLKVKGAPVPLADFVQATEEVVRQGLREGLNRATTPRVKWPPDWDAMTLPD
jgi:Apea-like HEPN